LSCVKSIQAALVSLDRLHRWYSDWLIVLVWCGALSVNACHVVTCRSLQDPCMVTTWIRATA
jgi:hypothetical protein